MTRHVIISGGFDPLHKGHIRLIKAARARSNENDCEGIVHVGLNSDDWLMRKKGYVFMPWEDRREILNFIRGRAIIHKFNDDDGTAIDLINIIQRLNGSHSEYIFANGGDRTVDNIPEMMYDKYKYPVKFEFGYGGDKIESSSKLVENASRF